MDRYPGYESMLARVEQKKVQVKGQLPTFYSHLVDNMVAFVLDQVNECCNVATVDATTDTAQDHHLSCSNEPVARAFADDTRVDVNEHVNTVNPQVNHQREAASGSISNEQNVSPPSPPSVTQSTIPTNIEVKVEDESNGQSVQLCEWIKKEEDEDDYEEQLFQCCDCGGEGCEECKVKREIKEEFDESGETEQMEDCVKQEIKDEFDESGCETELGGNSAQAVQGYTTVKKEVEDSEGEDERPNKMRRMDREVENGPVGSVSAFSSVHSSNVTSINVECIDDQVATSSTILITIEDHNQPSQPVTVSLPTPIVTPTQPSSTQHVNEPLRDELLNCEPMMDNVTPVVAVRADEVDREQVDDENATLNPVHTEQDDEEDEANVEYNQNDDDNEQREDLSSDEQQVQVAADNFVKRIEPDELGNKFECDYRACGKRAKFKTNLISHIRSHIGEKPFKCPVTDCHSAFVQKCQLDHHLNTHSGTRPFVCSWPRCEARFGSKANLTTHTRTHTGERPFKCETCNATFTQNGALTTHRRTHTGNRPFECDQCDATFTRHGNLVTHLRTHTGARPFVCTWPECGQAFTQSGNLKTHSLVHSNERQFACDVTGCSKVYKQKVTLSRHQKDKHN